jgi:magnesium transporter
MPLNVIVGIGGMSEFSMMTIPWTVSYSIFTVGLIIVAWVPFVILRVKKKKRPVHW